MLLREIFGIHELYHRPLPPQQSQQSQQQEQSQQSQQHESEELIGLVIHELHCTNVKSNKYTLKTTVLTGVPPELSSSTSSTSSLITTENESSSPSSNNTQQNRSSRFATREQIVSEWLYQLHFYTFQQKSLSSILSSAPPSPLTSVPPSPLPSPSSSSITVRPLKHQPVRQLLIFINPKSGPGKAVELFMKSAKPILDRSHLQYAIIITKRALEAYEYCRDELDLNVQREIVGVGGDGIIFEILNGVMAQINCRPCYVNETDERKRQILSRIRIGVIPAGTSNALASAIGAQLQVGQAPSVERAAFIIARGLYRPLDIVSMIQQQQQPQPSTQQSTTTTTTVVGETAQPVQSPPPAFTRYFAFLSLTWAFIADVDLGTENLRWMGSLRNYVGVLKGFGQYKMYNGKLEWLHDDSVANLEMMRQLHANIRHATPKSTYALISDDEDDGGNGNNNDDNSNDIGNNVDNNNHESNDNGNNDQIGNDENMTRNEIAESITDDSIQTNGTTTTTTTNQKASKEEEATTVEDNSTPVQQSSTDLDIASPSTQSTQQPFAQNMTWPPCPLLSTHFANKLSAHVVEAIRDKTGKIITTAPATATTTAVTTNVLTTTTAMTITDQPKASNDLVVDNQSTASEDSQRNVESRRPEIRTIDSPFFIFLASNLPVIAHDMPLTPLSSMDDNYIDLLLLRQPWSRSKLLNVFLNNILQGTHEAIEGIEYIKTKCFSLEPEHGLVAVDGEKVNTEAVFCEVHPGLINVFVDQ